MKIIGKSNFDLETESDILICENVNEYYGNKMVEYLNSIGGSNSTYYFKKVEDNYVLYDSSVIY